jgi:2-polyprenyl-3-methyl-5-hydroxy-6-metoxy-1,4-benzoquinol methylase
MSIVLPPQVRVDGTSETGRDMLVYSTSDIVSNDVRNTRQWAPPESQCYRDAMRSAAARRNLTAAEATFLDVGANIGWFTLMMAAHGCAFFVNVAHLHKLIAPLLRTHR